MTGKIWLASLVSAAVIGGCATKVSTVSTQGTTDFVDSFPKEGSELPYSVLRGDLIDGKTNQAFEIRNGGYGSAMTAHPSEANQFYALTDRGPNANYKGDYGKGKSFPIASYTPRIGLFEVEADGKVVMVKAILLKHPEGSLISGLPNSSALGGTGETPYHANGKPVLMNDDQPYDKVTNPIKLDDYGLDGEGLVALKDGTFWVSDEYGPHIVHFDSNGVEIGRINAFKDDGRDVFHLPAVFQHRRPNRGMEGLAITPDETTLVGIMQSTMKNPNKAAQKGDITRIVTVDLTNGKTEQYLYRQEKAQNANSEIATLTANKFLVIERDGSFLLGGPKKANPNAQKQVYRIDLTTGTKLSTVALSSSITRDVSHGLMIDGLTLEQYTEKNGWDALAAKDIKPVNKTLVVDMVKEVAYPHDKMEGLWVIDEHHLGVLNDDDFAAWSTKGKLEQKMLDTDTVDSNRLYIIKADLMGN
ncbi:esterase-like activity of phytase family protein [Marinomonas transparens]|uniref:Esterase-like activity of phytase family protein n=1 Tax=Marinomonas transparens TaxID=2795388 RepID=A0A934JIU0_9GAMM|nr:esterase-like activity of phytase family protein [Marinomonas transparens]MBJ7536850.1 esterase-like activity of phytase family protein [Marinomonas transparens]